MAVESRKVQVTDLQEHPLNYNEHPPEQIEDLPHSLRVFGQVRNIVAGHGLTTVARLEGIKELQANAIPADWPPPS